MMDDLDVQTGCLDPGDSFISMECSEGIPQIPGWAGAWLFVYENPDDSDLIYCVPIWPADQLPPEDEDSDIKYYHFYDEDGQNHLMYSINHGDWWSRESLIGKERHKWYESAAVHIRKHLCDIVSPVRGRPDDTN